MEIKLSLNYQKTSNSGWTIRWYPKFDNCDVHIYYCQWNIT